MKIKDILMTQLIKFISILVAVIWGVYVLNGWMQLNRILEQSSGNPFLDHAWVSNVRMSATIQTICVIALFIFGIFFKSSKNTEEIKDISYPVEDVIKEKNESVKDVEINSIQPSHKKSLIISMIIVAALIAIAFLIYIKQNPSSSQQEAAPASLATPQSSAPTSNQDNHASVGLSYQLVREMAISDGWKPYIRSDALIFNRQFPETQLCVEDFCSNEFINPNFPNMVRKIGYSICSRNRYYQCPKQPDGFLKVERDRVIEKSKADESFQSARQH